MSAAPRAIIITGAGAGIGRATARRFAAQGDVVCILDRDHAAGKSAAAELGSGHFALQVDVADEKALVAAIAEANARLGRIDVLVNNAATIFAGGGPALDLDMATWRKFVAINVEGVRVAARAVIAIMRAQEGRGIIVNLASLAGVVAVPANTGYSASKAAVIGLTQSLARECLPLGIRVNAVLPGFTATETLREVQRARGADTGITDRRIPLGRMAEPDEIAAAVQHLAAANTTATHGALLPADGGFHVYGGVGDAATPGAARSVPRPGQRVALINGADTPFGTAIATRLTKANMRVAAIDTGNPPIAGKINRIDLLVNADDGGSRPSGPGFDAPVAAALACAQTVVPAMTAGGGGAIVNLCSTSDPAAQEMMAMLSRSLACEWAKHGIRVNAVIPGAAGSTAQGVAAAVDFLGSHDASYITGATYRADGGASVQRS